MSRLYIDTCCIIYLIEAASPFHARVAQRLARHSATKAATLLTSRLA